MHRALILTAKSIETESVKEQLIGPVRSARTKRGHRFSVWHLRRNGCDNFVTDLEVALYETGRGQTPAAVYTLHVAEAFAPDVVLYVGCAGGDPEEVAIGDVVVATEVWNYERASVNENNQVRLKGHPLEADRVLIDECRGINEFGIWRGRIPSGSNNEATVRFGAVASGEKVIKDTQSDIWVGIKSSLSDEIIAAETEGHGFLAAISPLKTFGLMIRGVSDTLVGKGAFGKAHDDESQRRATRHAAAFAAQMLEEVDFRGLRATRRGEPNDVPGSVASEIISLEVLANVGAVPDLIQKFISTTGAVQVTLKKVEQGSVIVVLETEIKSAALADALFGGDLLSTLLGFSVRQCISSARITNDTNFDRWLSEVRRGQLDGPSSKTLDGQWKMLAIDLKEQSVARGKKSVGKQTRVFGRRDRINRLRHELALPMSEIARVAQISSQSISRALQGSIPVRLTTARRIFHALESLSRRSNLDRKLEFDDLFDYNPPNDGS